MQIVLMLLFIRIPYISFAQETTPADTLSIQRTSPGITPAKEIAIVGFNKLENDLTARVIAPKRDQNNEPCAIIKVVTKDKALFFEPDALGIVAREDQPGEIWLYVPHGSKRITIKHERYGIIRNYFYKETIDKATVYELTLYVPEEKNNGLQIIERLVEKKVTEQALMMNYSPASAHIYIDDELQQTDNNGAFSKVLPLGHHSYRIVAPHFSEKKGSFDIVPERPSALNIALQATYGFMTVSSNKNKTKIFINKKEVGLAPYKSDTLNVGTYTVRVERPWYVPQEQNIEIRPTETNPVQFGLERQNPNFFLLVQYGASLKESKQNSFGVMMGICRKGGAYLTVRTNGSPAFDWNYVSNPYGDYTGNTKKHHISLSTGFMARLMRPIYLYAGGGYLFRYLDWEVGESLNYGNGQYQTIQNHTGILVEAGLIGRYKCLALSAGLTQGIPIEGNGKYAEATISIGYVFGR